MPSCAVERERLDAAYADMEAAEQKCEELYLLQQISDLIYDECLLQWKHEMFETDIDVDDVVDCGALFGEKLAALAAWQDGCDEAFSAQMRAGAFYASLKDCENGHKFRNVTVWDGRGRR